MEIRDRPAAVSPEKRFCNKSLAKAGKAQDWDESEDLPHFVHNALEEMELRTNHLPFGHLPFTILVVGC